MSFSNINQRQLVFLSDVSITGHTIVNSEKDTAILPSDITIKRGLYGCYLSRKMRYNKGEMIRPKNWHRSGDHVDFNAGHFSFSVPMESVAMRNPDTGKVIAIKQKFEHNEQKEEV